LYIWKLRKQNLEKAAELAQKSVDYYAERFGEKGSGNYSHNRYEGCLVGTKCEYAVLGYLRWKLKGKNIQGDFQNLTSHTDIVCDDQKIEVKGLRNHQWDTFKRCIPPTQLDKYVAKGALVIWATTKAEKNDNKVLIRGWNWASEIKEKGVLRKTVCDNIWLANDRDMRSIESLYKVLSETINSEEK